MTDYERFGDYQPSDRSSVGLAITFLFIGLGAGALAALLFAPKSGKQMRRSLRRKYEDARDVFEELQDQAGDVIEKGTEWATSARDKGAEWASTAKEKVAPIAKAVKK
jgi:gas vesicle protein